MCDPLGLLMHWGVSPSLSSEKNSKHLHVYLHDSAGDFYLTPLGLKEQRSIIALSVVGQAQVVLSCCCSGGRIVPVSVDDMDRDFWKLSDN